MIRNDVIGVPLRARIENMDVWTGKESGNPYVAIELLVIDKNETRISNDHKGREYNLYAYFYPIGKDGKRNEYGIAALNHIFPDWNLNFAYFTAENIPQNPWFWCQLRVNKIKGNYEVESVWPNGKEPLVFASDRPSAEEIAQKYNNILQSGTSNPEPAIPPKTEEKPAYDPSTDDVPF